MTPSACHAEAAQCRKNADLERERGPERAEEVLVWERYSREWDELANAAETRERKMLQETES